MNSKSIQLDLTAQSNFDSAVLQPASVTGKIYRALSALLFRSELEKAQAGYRTKQQRMQQHQVFGDFSTEEKLRHGMYRWMD